MAAGIAAFESSSEKNNYHPPVTIATPATTFITPMEGTIVTSSSSFSPSTPPPPSSFPTTAVTARETEEEELGLVPQTMIQNNEQENNCRGNNEMQYSLDVSNNSNNRMGVSEEEEEEEEVVEWEDFMANYWKSIGNNNNNNNTSSASSSSSPLQSKVIIAMEDTDMKPCEIEPDLDEELNALSAIRTGCMDIDMDFNDDNDNDSNGKKITHVISSNDNAGMNQLSMIGLECSRAMANIVVAIVNDSSTSDKKKRNGMEGLRINVGRIERGLGGGGRIASGAIGARNSDTNNSRISPSDSKAISALGNNFNGTKSPSSPSSLNSNQPMNTIVSSRQKLEGTLLATHTHEVSSTLPPPTMATAVQLSTSHQQPTTLQQQSLDTIAVKSITAVANVDIDDNASGIEEGGGAGTTYRKIKASPLPMPELIRATGSILTRTSLRSLVMKKWHPSYWMQYGSHELLIFRSKDHMDDWRYNPYHGKKQRDFLVKLHIDFMADMVPAASDAAVGVEGGGSKGSSTTKEGILGHRILPVKKKSYGKNEEEM